LVVDEKLSVNAKPKRKLEKTSGCEDSQDAEVGMDKSINYYTAN